MAAQHKRPGYTASVERKIRARLLAVNKIETDPRALAAIRARIEAKRRKL